MGLFSTVLLVASVQGFFLSLVLFKKNWTGKSSDKILPTFIALITVTLWGRIFFEIPNKSILQWKLLFIGDTIIFLFGPIFYFYIRQIFNQSALTISKQLIHFIPSTIFLLSLLPLFIAEGYAMFSVYERLSRYYLTTEFAAIFQLLLYFFFSFQIINKAQEKQRGGKDENKQISFFRSVVLFMSAITVVWFVSASVNVLRPPEFDLYLIYHLVWIGLAIIIYLIGYISITDYSLVEIPIVSKKHKSHNADSSKKLELIVSTMEKSNAYKLPDITLQTFSDQCNLSPHEVSRILNEQAKVNFSEFVNKYRVNAFIRSLATNQHQNYTLLSLALEVGFSSKSTFNTSFKRFTGLTPSQYINKELKQN